MTNKDEASPRQRIIMEQRWAKAREECPAGTCIPASRFHIAGCERRRAHNNGQNVTVTPEGVVYPEQKVKVTRLETGETSTETIDHSDPHSMKKILDQHEKKAVLLEPQGFWNPDSHRWEHAHYSYGGYAEQIPVPPLPPVPESAPTRPWWKFWGRRG